MDYSRFLDETLLLLVARGNESALGELYDRYNGLVFSIALEILGDRDQADEVLQEVFARVWQRADTYAPDRGAVKHWIASLARYRAIDVLRRQTRRPDGHPVDLEEVDFRLSEDNPDPEEVVDQAFDRRRVRLALRQLPEEQRQVLALAYLRGLTHRQIADLLHLPVGTVKTRIRLGLQKLRKALDEQESP
ncbi:MAG: sigma-70 family RNA polymerase sigma factor [Anaerolineae bacterium]